MGHEVQALQIAVGVEVEMLVWMGEMRHEVVTARTCVALVDVVDTMWM